MRLTRAAPAPAKLSSPAKETDFLGFVNRVPLPPPTLLLVLQMLMLLPPPPPLPGPGPLLPPELLTVMLLRVLAAVVVETLPCERKMPPSKSGRRSSSPPRLFERDERDTTRLREVPRADAGDLEWVRFLVLDGGI